jgi:hypothetical protein
MNEELAQLDADLKGLFSENKIEEMNGLLQEQTDSVIIELTEFYCNVIRKYYETERFDLLFMHIRFVAFSCYIVEYAKQAELISEETYQGMMKIYQDVYDRKQQG